MSDRKEHWESVYQNNSLLGLSWYQEEPGLSLQLIRNTHIALDAPIIDVGGGASVLVDKLLDDGYTNIGVLDVSAQALAVAKNRLGGRAPGVNWYEEDVTLFRPPGQVSLWHDRAVFHFLTSKADRERYINVLKHTLAGGGHLIIMAFAIDGPVKCSGLDIVQYDTNKLMSELGSDFELKESGYETHITPAGKQQKFAYFHLLFTPETF